MDASSTGTKPKTPDQEVKSSTETLLSMTPDEQVTVPTAGWFPPVPRLSEEEFNERVAALERYVRENFRDN